MTKAQRTITTLLAVVAVLLAVNIAVSLNRPATAQQQLDIPVRAVAIEVYHTGQSYDHKVYRLWSDGTVEWNRVDAAYNCEFGGNATWCGWHVIPEE